MIESLVAGPNFDGLRRAIFVSIAGRFFAPELPSNLRKISSDGRNVVLEVLLARLPTRTLAEISSITKGRTGIKDAIPGKFPLVVTAEARGSSDHFDFEGPAVIIPTVSSTGHGDASLKRVHFQDGQYAVGSILAVVQPKAPDQISARFLHTYLSAFKDELLVSRMVGTANVSLTVAKIGTVPVPLLPIAAQRKVDELMALCDRLETRQSDAQAAHARLVDELLGSLLQARDAEDFAECWGRVKDNFDVLFTTEQSVDRLKQAVMQSAVTGKLSPPQVSQKNQGAARQEKWEIKDLSQVASEIVDCPHSTPKWTPDGELCVRTSQFKPGHLDLTVCKYVSASTYEERISRLRPMSGDILYSREGGILGVACRIPPNTKLCLGQRMMLIRPGSDVIGEYLELVLNAPLITDLAKSQTTGGAAPRINVSSVKKYPIPVPPLAEQHRIVAKVDEFMALCDRIKAKIARAQALNERLAGALVEWAVL